MNLKIVLLVSFVLLFCSCKKDNIYPEEVSKKFETSFGSSFELKVALPRNYDPNKNYKVLFLLDAEWLLGECKQAMSKNFSDPEYLIFGLAYSGKNNRKNDFTPSTTNEGTGNAEQLKNFIETDIFQHYIPASFPNISIDREHTIFIGHSLGGLFGTYLFVKNSPVFGKYMLISSALTYDAEKIFGIELDNRSNSMNQHTKLFFGTGSQEEAGFHSSLQHLQSVLSSFYPNTTYKSEVYKNTEHVGARVKALENGLPYLITP